MTSSIGHFRSFHFSRTSWRSLLRLRRLIQLRDREIAIAKSLRDEERRLVLVTHFTLNRWSGSWRNRQKSYSLFRRTGATIRIIFPVEVSLPTFDSYYRSPTVLFDITTIRHSARYPTRLVKSNRTRPYIVKCIETREKKKFPNFAFIFHFRTCAFDFSSRYAHCTFYTRFLPHCFCPTRSRWNKNEILNRTKRKI